MMIHIPLGGWGLIYMDTAPGYGASPWLRLTRFGDETIIDIPFCRMIVTPQHSRKSGCGATQTETPYFNRVGWNIDDERELWKLGQAAAEFTQDRP